MRECALGLVTSRLIGTGHFRPPVLGPKWCVVQWERTRVPITLTPNCTQPPGSRPRTLRVSTHGQQVAPFLEESYLSAWGCSRHIICPNRQGGLNKDIMQAWIADTLNIYCFHKPIKRQKSVHCFQYYDRDCF